ncbi:MAG TPA: SDR family oxidoreductase [Polyangiaceae bacterium]|nr:SDR family oxidoreductase [Polyangiaceae bacterium]
MDLSNKVVVVTGGAHGIGRALARRFAREGLRGIVVGDLDGAAAEETAREIGGLGLRVDVGVEGDVQRLAATAVERYGAIDVFCSNAGIFFGGGEEVADAEWRRIFDVNVMAHVYAARAVVPGMLARGGGAFVSTVSAAGLLSQIGSAPYAVTKHAALAFSEWLSITYGDRGLRVSCICPQGVRTAMLASGDTPSFLLEGALEPEVVADAAVQGVRDERFLILPHPEVATYFVRKASDYERWLRGMRRMQGKIHG